MMCALALICMYVCIHTPTTAESKHGARWSCSRRSTSICATAAGQAAHTRETTVHTQRIVRVLSTRDAHQRARNYRLKRGSAGARGSGALGQRVDGRAPHRRHSHVPPQHAPLGPSPQARHAVDRSSHRHRRTAVAPRPVAPLLEKDLGEVAPARPGSLAIRGGSANKHPEAAYRLMVGHPPGDDAIA